MVLLKDKKHLFFDLDDTLWDFEANSSAVLKILYDKYQLAENLGSSVEEFLSTYYRINLELWQKIYRRQITKVELRDARFQQTFLHFGYSSSEVEKSISADYLELAPQGTVLLKDCVSTLTYLSSKYSLHLITNGFAESQQVKIDGCGLRKFFKTIIISEEYQCVKPELEIFRIAERLSGAAAVECVMIGDSLESDITGATNAGWEAVYFSPKVNTFSGHTIAGLGELQLIF